MTDETKRQWAEINAVLNPPKAAEALPLPSTAPAGLTEAQKETLFSNWTSDINSRPASTWTETEKQAIRVASARVLKSLGY
ncbi:MAG: hypothetical protein LAQ69_20225 [Acidobacteriia bacterium]|nr:hypothetical protein [Terriglobia bacterium]